MMSNAQNAGSLCSSMEKEPAQRKAVESRTQPMNVWSATRRMTLTGRDRKTNASQPVLGLTMRFRTGSVEQGAMKASSMKMESAQIVKSMDARSV